MSFVTLAALNPSFQIIGQGLAGTCLAWALFEREVPFELLDRERGGSSRVAAGLINPVTGMRFEPSWRIDEFLPEAIAFYESLERTLGERFWHPLPVVRLTTG
ncbi:MAG TPA: FAD-dependent oxidoreductase, partial [Opitutaceae bacterium]